MEQTLQRTTSWRFMPGNIYSPETCFKPGQEPANKGKKYPGTGNVKSFRKGNLPHNTLYDNATRVRKNSKGRSYMFIRIGLNKWEFMQKYRWANEVGPIPEGMILVCKTADTLNCDPQNWELITRAELAARNRMSAVVVVKECVVCGESFETRRNRDKCCSAECSQKNTSALAKKWRAQHAKPATEARSMVIETKICIICGGEYKPKSNGQKTCSEACRNKKTENYRKARWAQTKPAPQEKHCSKCGQKFTPENTSRTICDDCKTLKPRTVKCLQCGKEFTKSGKGVELLCSPECRRNRIAYRKAIYARAYKHAPLIDLTCQICGNSFIARNGSLYCSTECKREAKNQKAISRRALIKDKVITENRKPVVCTCALCQKQFESPRRVKYCSAECRREVKITLQRKYYKATAAKTTASAYKPRKKAIKNPDQPPVHRQLNKRAPKSERDAALNMLELNRNAPAHDREQIEAREIVSPDLSQMEYRFYDPKLRITRFFKTEEKYLNYLKSIQ